MVGGSLEVKCEALTTGQPDFNLIHILPNGSKAPVEIGGNIKKRLGQDILVHVCSTLRFSYLCSSDELKGGGGGGC